MTAADIIAALEQVPTTRLDLLDIVAQAADANGNIDYQSLAAREPFMQSAVDQAQAYSERTIELLGNIKWTIGIHQF